MSGAKYAAVRKAVDDDLWDTNADAEVEIDDEQQHLGYVRRETQATAGSFCCLFGWWILCLMCQFLSLTINSTVMFDVYEEVYDANYMSSTPVEIYGPVLMLVTFLCAVAVWLVWMEGGCIRQRINIFTFIFHLVLITMIPDFFFASTYTFTSSSWTASTSELRTVALFLAAILFVVDFGLMISFWRVNLFAGMMMLPQVGWMCYVIGFIAISIDDLNVQWWIHALLIISSSFVLFTLCTICSVMCFSKIFKKNSTEGV